MQIEAMLLVSSVLVAAIELAVLVALILRMSDRPESSRKVKEDIRKIKEQIEE